jgi:hypothetical protein
VLKLLLTSQNPGELAVILRPVYDNCLRIVTLWNDQLSLLEEPFCRHAHNKGKAILEQRLLSFEDQNLQIWHRHTRVIPTFTGNQAGIFKTGIWLFSLHR